VEVAVKSYTFLFWGYLVVWAGLTAYFVMLGRRLASVARRVDTLEARAKGQNAPRAT
jgi:CcmD family protein